MFIKLYFLALSILAVIDGVWLAFIAKSFYAKQFGALMRPDINWIPVPVFYLLFAVALVVFAIMPAVAADSWQKALLLGALLGLTAYAAYDLTNLATLKNWPVLLTVVDMAWGTVLASLVSVLTYIIIKW